MDYIANEANISKRTLYELFEDKEALLVEGLELDFSTFCSWTNTLEKDAVSVIDVILVLYDEMLMKSRYYSDKFYDDMRKFPKALEGKKRHHDYVKGIIGNWLDRGLKEGVFREDIDFSILSLLAKKFMEKTTPSHQFEQHSYREVYSTIFMIFIRGICTAKGVAIIDNYVRKKKYEEILQI